MCTHCLVSYSRIPDLVELSNCLLTLVSLLYTFCHITSRLPVLTIRRALLFLVDQEAVPLMTRHLFVPSSARESAPTVRQWYRIPASFRAPLRVCDLRYCYSIAAPRNPMWFVWGGRNETCAKGGNTVREAPNENVYRYTHSCDLTRQFVPLAIKE